MRKINKIVAAVVLLLGISAAAFSQNIAGNWVWISPPNTHNERTAFSIDIKRAGKKLSGNLWFNTFIEGDETSDPSFIPFVGRMRGRTAVIEFNPQDLRPIWEEDMRYKKSKSPGKATLRVAGGKLVWTGDKSAIKMLGLPRLIRLKRSN